MLDPILQRRNDIAANILIALASGVGGKTAIDWTKTDLLVDRVHELANAMILRGLEPIPLDEHQAQRVSAHYKIEDEVPAQPRLDYGFTIKTGGTKPAAES